MTASVHNLPPLEPGTRRAGARARSHGTVVRALPAPRDSRCASPTRAAEPPGVAALRAQVPAAEIRTARSSRALLDGVAQVVISPGLSLREPVAVEA